MEKIKTAIRAIAFILSAVLVLSMTALTGGDFTPEKKQNAVAAENTTQVDVMMFIGQSNMAGRGESDNATVVEDGHGYEFRAVSDPTTLYPVTEPFGQYENNEVSGVTENKKTGSLVSAFIESYYAATGVPVVAVSCSKGGTGINFWEPSRPAYADAVARLNAARAFVDESDDMEVRGTYIVWLQGETDGDNGVPASRYAKTLGNILESFEKDAKVDHSFIIPIGRYNRNDIAVNARYDVIRSAQTEFCKENDNATNISIMLADLSDAGYMKDAFHFYQKGYEIAGADAGANAAYYVINKTDPECRHYESDVEYNKGGAWAEKDGKVVIPAAAAFENSVYAAATSRYQSDGLRYYWEKKPGITDGMRLVPDNGLNWNTGTGFERAPQLTYMFYIENPGRYYLYLMSDHPDMGGNSFMACIDENPLIDVAHGGYEPGLWDGDVKWAFDIAEKGEHTITICGREDGAVLNQIVLSLSDSENFKKGEPQPESERLPIAEKGAYVEINGSVCIDLYSAFEKNEVCGLYGAESGGVEYFWERSSNGSGVQIFPKDTAMWNSSTYVDAPKLTYKVEFTQPGEYYAYLYASFTDATSDSAMLGIDDAVPVELALSFSASGSNRWITGSTWKINVAEAGIHTINLYARESGATMHKLYLSQTALDSVGALNPGASPRPDMSGKSSFEEKNGIMFAQTDGNNKITSVFATAGSYRVFALAKNETASQFFVDFGDSRLTGTAGSEYAWIDLGTADMTSGNKEISFADAEIRYLYAAEASLLEIKRVETLVLGDSYTHKTYWTDFDSQMSEINARTIGVSGSTVNDWKGRVNELNLYMPENVVIHLGVNDINRGKTGTECGSAVTSFIASIKTAFPDTKIFYVTVSPNNGNSGKWAEYDINNGIVKEYAEKTENVYVVDFAEIIKQHKTAGDLPNNGYRGDNLHLNDSGYQLFSQAIVDAVKAARE